MAGMLTNPDGSLTTLAKNLELLDIFFTTVFTVELLLNVLPIPLAMSMPTPVSVSVSVSVSMFMLMCMGIYLCLYLPCLHRLVGLFSRSL